jgi:hypothetical protein
MSSTMTRTQIYIQPELLEEAKLAAKSKGINLSQCIRDCISGSFQQLPKTKKSFLDIKTYKAINPIITNEPWELSKKIDEIVYDL